MTPRLQRACSGPPESHSEPYAGGPGTAGNPSAIRVVPPDEPPCLTPGAAVALLRILLSAYERLKQKEMRKEN